MSAPTKICAIAFALIIMSGGYTQVSGQTNATCQSPPGTISCESTQAATCDPSSGQVVGTCKTPSKGMTIEEMSAWLLSIILRREVTVSDIRNNNTYQEYVSQGKVSAGGRGVTFSFPREYDYARSVSPTSPDSPSRPSQPPPSTAPNNPSVPGVLQGDPKVDRPPTALPPQSTPKQRP